MTHWNETLVEQIERLVHTHMEAMRREASEAVVRAFASALTGPRARTAPKQAHRVVGRRRGAAALSALGDRLFDAVRAQPGETMAVLAPGLGCSPRELHRPMAALKQAGRVRSVGQRHLTRYYPAAARSVS